MLNYLILKNTMNAMMSLKKYGEKLKILMRKNSTKELSKYLLRFIYLEKKDFLELKKFMRGLN